MTNPLSTECKDLAFARNLIKQMKGEGGRHNSTASPARVSGTPAGGVVVAQEPVGPIASPPSELASLHYLRFLQQEVERSVSFDLAMPGSYRTATEIQRRWAEFSEACAPFNPSASTGRWGNHWIKSAPQHCNIGDACRVTEINCMRDTLKWYGEKPHDWIPTPDSHFWLFKKVATEMIGVYGDAFQTEYYWERVE